MGMSVAASGELCEYGRRLALLTSYMKIVDAENGSEAAAAAVLDTGRREEEIEMHLLMIIDEERPVLYRFLAQGL